MTEPVTHQDHPPPDEARETAADAWIWGFALLENYRTMYPQAIDPQDPRYVGGFGTFRHYSEPFTPENTDVVTPNNDTPYSWAWLDLRAEPWVVSVPEIDRYYVLPFHDLDTSYVGFVGARTTGPEAGDYLIAGPGWRGEVPPGITGVLRADTFLVGCLGRTYLAGPEDVAELRAVQEGYRLRSLSEFLDTAAPHPPEEPVWPTWREEDLANVEFFTLLDFLLQFFPPLEQDRELRARLAALGVRGTGEFEPSAFAPEVRHAVEQGIADARARLEAAKRDAVDSTGWFGTREEHGTDFLTRAVGVDKGLYGLPSAEAWYAGWAVDDQGNRPPDASKRAYTVHFAPGALPPARFFWSATMYRLPERLLTANPIDCYSIGDRTPGLVHDDDGGLTLYVAKGRPENPKQAANWLPAPDGPFTIAVRVYGPDSSVLEGSWTIPPLTVSGDSGLTA
ncbi:DUF1254 domain-containing protein [Streptomyces durmitorensis]|uniref:DUF1254 domain-containing protein n=1 Tax=Streptomyces durmitorensis TaxID=319947 RepID=A0ABY4PWP2_9ACTN|nr:DUF1254 domain-containing protein [Streptomyces durmitorensis]UQT57381.1 DUF1254 domain-containing protein [Streptomyces durmitorensis]